MVGNYFEHSEGLVQHGSMLGRHADFGDNAVAMILELANDRRHLDRLRPRAEDAKDTDGCKTPACHLRTTNSALSKPQNKDAQRSALSPMTSGKENWVELIIETLYSIVSSLADDGWQRANQLLEEPSRAAGAVSTLNTKRNSRKLARVSSLS